MELETPLRLRQSSFVGVGVCFRNVSLFQTNAYVL